MSWGNSICIVFMDLFLPCFIHISKLNFLCMIVQGRIYLNFDFLLATRSIKYCSVCSLHLRKKYCLQTDADVDLRGIRMHTVALRREEMVASGVDLIRWVDYYIAYVQAYTLVSSANVVHLLLPSDCKLRISQFYVAYGNDNFFHVLEFTFDCFEKKSSYFIYIL